MNEITIQVPERENLPPSLLANIETGFKSAFEQAEKWRTQALSIHVTSLDQKAEMKLARTIRLELKNIRVAAEKERVKLKSNALLMGKAIDGVNNLLLAAIVPLEKHLEEQEQYGERLAAQARERLNLERTNELAPFLADGQIVPQLADMTEDQWSAYLSDAKLIYSAKIETARKAEAERIAREQAEAAERERLRVENEKLRQAAMEAEAKAKAEREAAEKAQREAAEIARKEREAIEAKAKAEREAAEKEIARIKAEADKAAKIEAERQAYEAAKQKSAEDAAKKAARAPDKQKALAFAATVRTLKAPDASTVEGKAVMAEITSKVEAFAKWIETQASNL